MALDIVTIPCLRDNYCFLMRDDATGTVALVDAPEREPIADALAARGWGLDLILVTHHHHDHVAAIPDLVAAHDVKLVGAAADRHRLPPLDQAVAPGDTVRVGAAEGRVIAVPGHTSGHIAFVFEADRAAFTGDSLMALGCGRVMEGTHEEMWASLSKLAALPPDTRIYSGHEYTENNARFALTVDPDNSALQARAAAIRGARAAGRPTVPSVLSEELATNPFLRASDAGLKAAIGLAGAPDVAVFAEIRGRKDRF